MIFTRRNFVEKTLKILSFSTMIVAIPSSTIQGAEKKQSGYNEPLQVDELEVIKKLLAQKVPMKWVFVGDSITHGAKHTYGYRSYPETFSERIRYEMKRGRDVVVNMGISGNTSNDILSDYDWRIAQFTPRVVFIMIGTNDADVKRNISLEKFKLNMLELVDKIRSNGAVPILQTPNITIEEKAIGRERLKYYVQVIREVSKERATILVDHWAYWTEMASVTPNVVNAQWLMDELHPNGRGHDEMARLIFKQLSIFDPTQFTGKDHWSTKNQ